MLKVNSTIILFIIGRNYIATIKPCGTPLRIGIEDIMN